MKSGHGIPETLLAQFSAFIAARLGLHFPRERWHDLERGINAAAGDFGQLDAQTCIERLISRPLTRREIEMLASHLTVGETYFFREENSFAALEAHILPELLQRRRSGEQRLRIWSAGCCTGEEPYSMAILLNRLIPDPDDWNLTLLATDINPLFLRKAAAGEYGEWSFRSTPDWIKDRYFHPMGGGRFELDARIRKRVTFAYLNLADDVYPSLTNDTSAMDLIFCRNVLMYFSAERGRAVVDNLYRALVDGGWLIVSPAETSSTLFSRFTAVEFAGALLYRKDTSAEALRFASHAPVPDSIYEPRRLIQENIPAVAVLPGSLRAASPVADACDGSVPIARQQDRFSCAARDCANQGRLDEAAEWCSKAIAADKLNPIHHYLLSAIQREQGQGDAAAQSLTRVLFLAPDFVLAHYALGNLSQSQGRRREAQRHFDNALAALRVHPPDEILPESDGLTAGRLAEIIESMRSSMPQPTTHL